MTTPEQARELADWIAKKLGYAGVADDIRDLARQVEELQADADRLETLRGALQRERDGYWLPEWWFGSKTGDRPTQQEFRALLDNRKTK